ncbi:hypothetical protein [Bacteroides acidifaciens]|uniref:hypothetical protein n=1 Tax=Bacteroides acidifaciens TaxID=85831 RepID=UPI0025B42B3E|nr:hypothetical protein [Bacteroides acidifaciens]
MESSRIGILVDELKGYLHPEFYTKGAAAIERLIIAAAEKTYYQTLYLCDEKQCGDSCTSAECKHTSNISHAKNFVKDEQNNYWEKNDNKISENMTQSERMELWGCLIDVVEDWLGEKGITADNIPNDDRKDVEDAAIIFGDDYDYLADRFAEVIGISRDCVEEELLSKFCPNLDGPVSVSMTMPGDFDGDELK